jgi:hypothetical protein
MSRGSKSAGPARLIGVHSQPGVDEITGDLDGRQVWENASLRIVHRQRARKLRHRGEQVVDTDERTKRGRKISMWFVERYA